MAIFDDVEKQQRYVFGDFTLDSKGVLFHRERKIHIPPKELAVLTTLLESAGQLVTKDTLLNQVWADDDVSEESLTRCIYVLRRVLLESKNCRYIDTVYGKGYRFSSPVVGISKKEPEAPQCLIAILPFQTYEYLDSTNLHSSLVQGISQYLPFGLTVLPVTMTQHCQNFTDIVSLIEKLNPDYYLAGKVVSYSDKIKIRVELVRANGHSLIHHENIDVCPEQPIVLLQNWLANLLPRYITGLRWSQGQAKSMRSFDAAIIYLNARHELQRYTPSSVRQALSMLRQCVGLEGDSAPLYSSLAECYLTLSQMGLFDQQLAIAQARKAANKAVELDPCNPQALALLALLSGMHSDHTIAKVLFKQARLQAPDSLDVHYYYAWYKFVTGDLVKAQKILDDCLKHDPTYIAAAVLRLWLTYYNSCLDDAITLANQQLCRYGQDHPVLQSMQALFLALQGKSAQAESLIHAVRISGEDVGLIAVNLSYADYCLRGNSILPTLETFLNAVDSRHVRASLLPLIMVVHGEDSALRFWEELQDNGYLWINVWRHDPRLKVLFKNGLFNNPEAA